MKTQFKFFGPLFSFLLVAVGVLSLQSCYKTDYTTTNNTSYYDNSNTVTASVYGIVQDEAGAPVKAAVVTTSGYTALTDDNGLFYFNDIITPSHATTVIVKKDGYFNGSRTLTVNAAQKHTVKIALLKKDIPEVFNANNGGTVNFANGLSITFPAKAIINKLTGVAYNGQVYVYAKKIDPTTPSGLNSMPGDLRGLTTTGYEKLLETRGMMVAEMFDINGSPVQIANTSSATISLTVPVSLMTNAPASIALWYFDEAKGIWAEEGTAALDGNKYVGKVKHFSFWNCDTPMDAINIEMTLHDQNGNPLQNYVVRLTNTANLIHRDGYTNGSGWVGGMCYSSAVLTLEVFDNNICGFASPLYSTTITTGATNMNLGIITVNLALVTGCSFTANVQDCLGAPIANAMVYVQPLNLLLTPDALGNITYSLPCTPVAPITLTAYDLTNNVYGSTTYTLATGPNAIGILNACGNVSPFLSITLTNTVTMASASKTFLVPVDVLSFYIQGGISYMYASTNPGVSSVSLTIAGTSVGTFNVNTAGVNGIGAFTDTMFTMTGINTATFTAYPAFPGDVQGTYGVNLIGTPSGDTYTATGAYRIPRNN